jgi:hypothetical protein
MSETADILQVIRERSKELGERKKELYLLKHVAGGLRNYRKMIPIKRYD